MCCRYTVSLDVNTYQLIVDKLCTCTSEAGRFKAVNAAVVERWAAATDEEAARWNYQAEVQNRDPRRFLETMSEKEKVAFADKVHDRIAISLSLLRKYPHDNCFIHLSPRNPYSQFVV